MEDGRYGLWRLRIDDNDDDDDDDDDDEFLRNPVNKLTQMKT